MSNTIHLPINRKWFDIILSGEKKEEYREIKPYWAKRLTSGRLPCINSPSCFKRHFGEPKRIGLKNGKTTLTLTAGYGNDKPRLIVELLGAEIKYPNPAWCPPDTHGLWFALKLGRVLETKNI